MKNLAKHAFNTVVGVAGATVSAAASLAMTADMLSALQGAPPLMDSGETTTAGLLLLGGLALFTGAYKRWTSAPKTNDGADMAGLAKTVFHSAAAYVGGAVAGLANPEAALAGLGLFLVGYGRLFSDKPVPEKKQEKPAALLQEPRTPA